MKKYINDLIEIGMGSVIDMSADKIIMEDDSYRKNIKDAEKIYDKLYDSMTQEQRDVLEDYMDCIMSANERACNLTYLVGARNTIQFLSEINALKTDSI